MNNNKNDPVINKIEVDEKTGIPRIVEVPLSSIDNNLEQLNILPLQEDSEQETSKSSKKNKAKDKNAISGKQLVMNKILGFADYNSVSKRQKLFKNIFTIAFIVIIVGVLAFTFYNDFFGNTAREPFNPEKFRQIMETSWYFIIFALISLALCYIFKGLKMSIMCKSMTKKFNLRTCLETGVIGQYYNNVTPLAVGGQPFEIYHLSKHGVHGGVASSLPIASFFLNQYAYVIFAIISLISFSHNSLNMPVEFFNQFAPYSKAFTVMAWIGLTLCLIMPTLVIIFSLLPKLCAMLVKFVMWIGGKFHIVKKPKETTYRTMKTVIHNQRCLKKLAKKPFVFFLSIALSFCEHLALTSIAYFTIKFFGFKLVGMSGIAEWMQICMLCTILYVAISFIPTPGNSGAADISFYILFEIGLMAGLRFPAMIVWRILSYYSFIIIGFIFINIKKRLDRKNQLKALTTFNNK